jgi:hypoxia up-regulated 1
MPAIVGFDAEERLFGNGATSMAKRKPHLTSVYSKWMIGKSATSSGVERMKESHFPFEIVESDRGAAAYNFGVNKTFTSEELMAMTFENIAKLAAIDAEMPVVDCVVTVPHFFNQVQRQAVRDAAELAGLKVLSLVNENAAFALQFGLDHDYSNHSELYIFYNMGSSSTQVSLARMSSYTKKVRGKNKTIGQVETIGYSHDTTLGGQSLDNLVLDKFAKATNEQVGPKAGPDFDAYKIPRVMAKLRAAARRTKEVLSANTETPVYIEGVHKDFDLRTHVSRDELTEMAKPLLARVLAPLEQLLIEQQVQLSDVKKVMLIGGGVRVPAIQSLIRDYVKGQTELGFNINADEAGAFGATFLAANISTRFQVRQVGFIDVTPFPVGVHLQDIKTVEADADADADAGSDSDGEDSSDALDKRTAIFSRFHRLSRRKSVSLKNVARDLHITMQHDNAETLLEKGDSAQIANFNVSGIADVIADEANARFKENGTLPKVTVSFVLNGDGCVEIDSAEASFTEQVQVEVPPKKEKKSKTKTSKKADTKKTAKAEEASKEKTADGDDDSSDADKKDKEVEEASQDKKQEEAAEADNKDSAEKEEASKSDDSQEEAAETETEPEAEPEKEYVWKKKTHKFPLRVKKGPASSGIQFMSQKHKNAARRVLKALSRADALRKEIAASKNNLESFVYSTRSKMYEEEVEAVTTEEEREAIGTLLEETGDWLYEQPDDSPTPFYNRMHEIEAKVDPIFDRANEYTLRPEAIKAGHEMIQNAREVVKKLRSDRKWVKEEDVAGLEKAIDEYETWLDNKIKDQAALERHETPVLRAAAIRSRGRTLAKKAAALLKIKKPKVKKPKKNATATDANSTANATEADPAATAETAKDPKADEEQVESEQPKDAEADSEVEAEAEADVDVEADVEADTDAEAEADKSQEGQKAEDDAASGETDEHDEL